ncbi:potassium-transporting ATPase subunit F [Pseudochelatococcus sp. B33]
MSRFRVPICTRARGGLTNGAGVFAGGHHGARNWNCILRIDVWLHQDMRKALIGGFKMVAEYILGAVVAVFITCYLTYALVRPERF